MNNCESTEKRERSMMKKRLVLIGLLAVAALAVAPLHTVAQDAEAKPDVAAGTILPE